MPFRHYFLILFSFPLCMSAGENLWNYSCDNFCSPFGWTTAPQIHSAGSGERRCNISKWSGPALELVGWLGFRVNETSSACPEVHADASYPVPSNFKRKMVLKTPSAPTCTLFTSTFIEKRSESGQVDYFWVQISNFVGINESVILLRNHTSGLPVPLSAGMRYPITCLGSKQCNRYAALWDGHKPYRNSLFANLPMKKFLEYRRLPLRLRRMQIIWIT